MAYPSVLDIFFINHAEVRLHHWQFLFKLFFVLFLGLSLNVRILFGKLFNLRVESCDGSDHAFGDHGISQLIEPEIELFLEHACLYSDRRFQVFILCWFFFRQLLLYLLQNGGISRRLVESFFYLLAHSLVSFLRHFNRILLHNLFIFCGILCLHLYSTSSINFTNKSSEFVKMNYDEMII